MSKLPAFDRPSINQYRHQRFWQIIFPMVIFSLMIMVAGILTVLASAENDRLLADISIIWLVIPILIFSLFLMAVLVGLIYGMSKLISIMPIYTRRAQNLFSRIEIETRKVANTSTKPVFWLKQVNTNLKIFLNSIKIKK